MILKGKRGTASRVRLGTVTAGIPARTAAPAHRPPVRVRAGIPHPMCSASEHRLVIAPFAAFGSPEAGPEASSPAANRPGGPGPSLSPGSSTRRRLCGGGRAEAGTRGQAGRDAVGGRGSAAICEEGRRGVGRGLDNRSTVRGVWKGHERRDRRPRLTGLGTRPLADRAVRVDGRRDPGLVGSRPALRGGRNPGG